MVLQERDEVNTTVILIALAYSTRDDQSEKQGDRY